MIERIEYALRWQGHDEIPDGYVSYESDRADVVRASLEQGLREGWGEHASVVTRTITITEWKEG